MAEPQELRRESLSLWSKIAIISGKLGALKKDGRYDGGTRGGSYTFISQAQVVAEIRHELMEYLVAIEPSMVSADTENITKSSTWDGKTTEKVSRRVSVKMAFRVVNGERPEEVIEATWFGEAIDAGDKGTQKAATSAEKYYLMKLFKVSDQEDPDADGPEAEVSTDRPSGRNQLPEGSLYDPQLPSPEQPAAANGTARAPRCPSGVETEPLTIVQEQALRSWVDHTCGGLGTFDLWTKRILAKIPASELQVRHGAAIWHKAQREAVAASTEVA